MTTLAGENSPALPAPLLGRVEPVAGECLLSLLARACEANVFHRIGDLLGLAGASGHPAFSPFIAQDRADAIAALLGLSPDEVERRMHPPLPGPNAPVHWFGMAIPRRMLEAKLRRISPAALGRSLHHRAIWSHRGLTFCPETFEYLISDCPNCGQQLGWVVTYGLDRCEACKASLLDGAPGTVAEDLRAPVRHLTELIHFDASVRLAALARLPSPFPTWRPEDAFEAVLELGLAWEAGAGAPRSARALRIGDVTPEALASGYRIVQGWPETLTDLVRQLHAPQAKQTPAPPTALRSLGRLGRFFDSGREDTPFSALLKASIADAALAAGSPLKFGGLRHLRGNDGSSLCDTLTLKEAERRFGVTSKVMRRLVPDGACVLAGELGRGGSVRLDAKKLAHSLAERARGLTPTQASERLGIPRYCLDTFVEEDFFKVIDDRDATAMEGVPRLYDRASVETYIDDCDEIEPKAGLGVRVADLLARRFDPRDWTTVFDSISTGELPLLVSPRAGETEFVPSVLTKRLWADQGAVDALLAGRDSERTTPPDCELNANEVATLLGISPIYVGELIDIGLLPVSGTNQRRTLKLSDVVAFDAVYLLSTELNPLLWKVQRGATDPFSEHHAFATRHLRAWLRQEMRSVVRELGGR